MNEPSAQSRNTQLGARSIADALQAFAVTIGCAVETLHESQVTAVTRMECDDRAVRTFLRGASGVVSLPSGQDWESGVEPKELDELVNLTRHEIAAGSIVDLAGARLLVGDDPATMSIVDEYTLRQPMRAPASIVIDPKPAVVDSLRNLVLPHEWAAGGSDADGVRRVGALAGGSLVALASVEHTAGRMARLRVIVAPGYRRRGFGRTVLFELVRIVLREGSLPYARLALSDLAARALATTVGFVAFARALTLHVIAVRDPVYGEVAPGRSY